MMKSVHSIAIALVMGGTLAVSATPAMARVDFELSIGVPGLYVQPAPVYVEPAPVYVVPGPVYRQPYPAYGYPEPIYTQPYPYYDQPRLVYENGHRYRGRPLQRRHGHRDFDRDGVPDFRDGDRDGDGVSNRDDRRPNDGYRY